VRDLEWISSSKEDLKDFPRDVQRDIGFALHRVQSGETPEEAKPLRGFPGVYEIRSNFDTDTFRAVYALKIGAKIYVLHTFQKKSKSGISTPKRDMDRIAERLKYAVALAKENSS